MIPGAPPPPPKTKLGGILFFRIQRARLLINIALGGGGELALHKNKTVVKFLAGLIRKRRARKKLDREEESEVGID